jgi:hypothetical protein
LYGSRCYSTVLSVALIFFVFTFSAFAPSQGESPKGESGYVSGTVTDQTGAVVPGTKVFFKSGSASDSVTTAADGKYEIALRRGQYQIYVEKRGFCYDRAPLNVATATPLTINARLSTCAIADVNTIEDGRSSQRDVLMPTYK